MGTIKKSAVLAASLFGLSACAVFPQTENMPVDGNHLTEYTVKQNDIGEYVFCKNNDCPVWERKELAETPFSDGLPELRDEQSVRVFFNLGSAKLGAGARETLQNVLPKLQNTNVIYLRGWADSIGGKNTKINRRLAKQRAEAIRTWLRQNGVTVHISTASNPACCNRDDTRTVVITW